MSDTGIPVRIEVVRILEGGECPLGHAVGDSWLVADGFCPQGLCSHAWSAIEPCVFALRCGGAFPWSGRKETEVCCPDAANPVVFRVWAESSDESAEA